MEDREAMVSLLNAARARGDTALAGKTLPIGLDKFSVYAGLIQSALELGKLVETESRDLEALGTHYQLEMARIEAALREVGGAMILDFERDQSLRASTFESINLLIAAGQFEVAAEFHKRLLEGLSRPALEVLVETRNAIASSSGTRWRLR